jgi:PAS domain S-box-containing protein
MAASLDSVTRELVRTDLNGAQQAADDIDELSNLYRTAPIGLALLDADLRFVRVNERLAEINGRPAAEHLSKRFSEIVPDLAAQGEIVCRRVLQTGESVLNVEIEGETFARPGVRRVWNGSWHPIKNADGRTIAINAVIEEITERRMAERRCIEDARIKDALYRLTDEMQRAASLDDVYAASLQAIQNALRCDRASILLYDEAKIMRFVGWKALSRQYREAVEGHSPWTPEETDPKPIAIGDIEAADLDDALKTVVRAEGISGLVFIPLMSGQRLIGKFMAYFNAQHDFTEEEFELSLAIARQLSFGIEHKRAENALRESERYFRELLDALPAAIYTTDAEGRVTHFNPAAVEFSGRTPEIGTDRWCVTWKLFRPDGSFLPHAQCPMAVALKEGRPIRGEEAILERPDGSRRWFAPFPTPVKDRHGKTIGGINMLMDITELKEAEHALQKHASQLSLVTDIAPVYIAYCDVDSRLKFVNAPYAARFGLTPREIVGRHVSELVGAESFAAGAAHVEAVLRGERVEFDTKVQQPLNGERLLHCWFAPEISPDGRVVGFVAALADITERMKTEEALRTSEEKLKETDRRKDEFLAMLSHELRNPLAPIANAVHVLRRERSTSATFEQARAIIERQSARLAHLVDDLLEVSRITTGRIQLLMERVAVHGIVERAIESVRPLIERHRHSLTVSLPSELAWVEGDSARLEQVIVNLLTNAAKYTDDGGNIELTVRGDGEKIRIDVRDNGIGIDASLLPRVFDLFTQSDRALDRSQGGLGIGLALVQRLVSMHGGQVHVESELDKGSIFTVWLPAAHAPEHQFTITRSLSAQANTTALRVLIVDDNKDAAQSLAMLVEASQHTTCLAYDGLEALEAVQKFAPQVVFLDIGLPKITGYEVAKRLRAMKIEPITLVALTGYGQPKDRELALEAGFDHHLVKPIDFTLAEDILSEASRQLTRKSR